MKIYELRENNSAETYYEVTRQLAEKLEEQLSVLEPCIRAYLKYLPECQQQEHITMVECGIELLDLAILHRWLCRMNNFRENDLKDVTYAELTESTSFMEASGEFKEELLRFGYWMDFLNGLSKDEWQDVWSRIRSVVMEIDRLGEQYLKRYLLPLENWRKHHRNMWQTREDAGLILRDESCYYLNMIAAQMLNKCYREAFLACEKIYIFLPGCMAERQEKCLAVEECDGYVCQACTESCQINRLSKEYPGVRIVYHGSQMDKRRVKSGQNTGVIGVSCILNLISGGWKAKRLGYVPQCVILNECGCRAHWSEQGMVTSLDEKELAKERNK